jgi:uncharacterized protein with PIN domain
LNCPKCGNELKRECNNYTTIKGSKIVNLGHTEKWHCEKCNKTFFDIGQSRKIDEKLKGV